MNVLVVPNEKVVTIQNYRYYLLCYTTAMIKVVIFDFWGVIYDPRTGDLMKGVAEYVTSLSNQHIKLGIASSSSRNYIFDYLSHYNLINSFDVIIGANDVARTKPHPDCYLEVAKHFKAQPGQCLIIDDSIAPIEHAKPLGFKTVLFGVEAQEFRDIEL